MEIETPSFSAILGNHLRLLVYWLQISVKIKLVILRAREPAKFLIFSLGCAPPPISRDCLT